MLLEALGAGIAASAGIMAYGVRGRSSSMFGRSVYRGPSDRPVVALTFDDGPSESTPKLLEVLRRYGIRATFFQCGINAVRLPEVARKVAAAGHQIGNHTYSHARLYFRSPTFIQEELYRAQKVLEESIGFAPRLFRAPYGARWPGLEAAQVRLGLLGVMWTANALDWKLPAGRIASRLSRRTCKGAIFCLHDGRETLIAPDIRSTIEAVNLLVPELLARGYQFQTVSQMLCLQN